MSEVITGTAATTTVVGEKKKTEPRPYVVLRNVTEKPTSPADQLVKATAQTWEFVRNVEATSAEQAVRKAAEILVAASEPGDAVSATLVAVSASRFVPVTFTVETKTQLKLS